MEKDTTKTSWDILKDYFSKKSMMEILGVDRDENAHSKFLGWLFENKDTRDVAIRSLLSLLNVRKTSVEQIPCSLVFDDRKEISNVEVKLEDFVVVNPCDINPKAEQKEEVYGRADIVIDLKYGQEPLHIIIENKIDSFEHKMGKGQKLEAEEGSIWQTEGYNYYYKEKYDKNCIFAFLTRPNIDKEKCKKFFENKKNPYKTDGGPQCDSFIPINYQNVLDSILVEVVNDLNKKMKETESGTDRYAYLSELIIRIDDYIRCLRINKTQENLMAISSDSEIAKLAYEVWIDNKKLFNDLVGNRSDQNIFWRENKEFIQPLFEILAYLCDIDDEKGKNEIKEKEQIRDIKNIVNGKDFTTYEIKKDGTHISVEYTIRKKSINAQKLGKNALVRTVVWLYMHENKEMRDLKALQSAFPISLRIKGKRFNSDAITNKVIDDEKRDRWKPIKDIKVFCDNKELDPIELKKDLYVIQTGWDGTDMMNRFIEHAHKLLGDNYHIEEVVPEEQTKANDD